MIQALLEDLEHRIDPQVEARLLDQWKAFADGRIADGVFSPRRPAPAPASLEWPHVLVNDALQEPELMVVQQLEMCSKALAEGSGALLAVRCNYGTAILPSLFGAEVFLMDREIDTLPACRPLEGGADAVKRLLDRGVPDLDSGQGEIVFRVGRYFRQLLREFPRLAEFVYLYHPDLQGPMNVCEMLWGGSLYVDFYDRPDLIKDFLSLITETYIRFMRRWNEVVARPSSLVAREQPSMSSFERRGPSDERRPYAVHWSMLHRGRIMIRNDAATNFSPAMYEEFVRPYDQRLLDALGGGAVHFCGRGDHLIEKIAALTGLHAINITQPALNDMETIFRHTIDRGINLIGLEAEAVEQAAGRGRSLHGRAHCW
jgi:plasmid stabilization system protein ParE